MTADQDYYREHGIEDDRLALWYYARVVRHLRPTGGRLLDFGCGTGHLLRRLSARFDACGYDASAYARSQARLNAPDATILEEWGSQRTRSFDIIVALHTLEHLRRPPAVMTQLAPLLTPGGVFLFVVPNTNSLGRRLKRDRWFAHRDAHLHSLLSRGEWVGLAREAGLDVQWVCGDGWWDVPYLRLVPASLQRAVFGVPAAVQLFWPRARPFLPPAFGECLIVSAIRS
ncbi:MAG TPA: class I SAM-dependent methyltransferase [Candidatus Binatia bacterium]|nr:class I SAM-dependent methyltransferase [Candidatus Binatia bacterium]